MPAGDPGLQPERTALAWQRTGVAGSGVGGVALFAAAHRGSMPVLAVVTALVAMSAVAAGYVGTRPQPPLPGDDTSLPSPWPRLVATALVPVLLAVIGLALALTG